ncbi:hypothetical protein FSW04_12590 [Baekduia soli]|uniref:Uncharacterized protein n=1 Tax=Baekduia soli TaxID=496014 RepID=A0A5B8U5V7_9ACTN|nr:hypothetical protein [Baekduia soli]QEC48321.1 hypothetical protein FSW04_12590 [Baekduia soli]
MISTFGALNGWILLQGGGPLAAAQDGMSPPQFARVHGRRVRRSAAGSSRPCWSPPIMSGSDLVAAPPLTAIGAGDAR